MVSVFRSYLRSASQSGVPRTLSEQETRTISEVFHNCDESHKGYLTKEDVKVAVLSLFGYKPSKVEVNELFKTVEPNDDGILGMSMETFTKLMSSKMSAKDSCEEIRQMFLTFDSQYRGFLTVEDLKKAFLQVAPKIPPHTIESAFREIDTDWDGRISYKDFELMMEYNMLD